MDIKKAFTLPTFDYESPIERITKDMQIQQEERDWDYLKIRITQEIGYEINKDELIKALQYDRGQYEKGFQDGYNCPKWIPVSEKLPEAPGKYLVTVQNGNVYAGTFDAYSGRFQCAAIAWQPLPEPYKEEDHETDRR